MRYYKIKIEGGLEFCSVVNGQNDPGALDVEFQLTVAHFQVTAGASNYVKIWGVPLSLIGNANKLFKKSIEVYGGMTDGLPLATFQVSNQGLLCSGTIMPAFGNWQGTDISLDMIIAPGGEGTPGMGAPNDHKNIIHNWPANTPLSQSVENTLKTAFPKMKLNINISDNLKLSYPDLGFYNSIGQFSQYINAISMSILGKKKGYSGVKTFVKNNTIHVMDNEKGPSNGTIKIDYRDLIGQPMWVDQGTIQVKVIQRHDIDQADTFTLPPCLITMSAGGGWGAQISEIGSSNISNTSQVFTVKTVSHYGKFRQNDSSSWCTVIDATVAGSGSDTNSSGS